VRGENSKDTDDAHDGSDEGNRCSRTSHTESRCRTDPGQCEAGTLLRELEITWTRYAADRAAIACAGNIGWRAVRIEHLAGLCGGNDCAFGAFIESWLRGNHLLRGSSGIDRTERRPSVIRSKNDIASESPARIVSECEHFVS
jgi:hypothetical protein